MTGEDGARARFEALLTPSGRALLDRLAAMEPSGGAAVSLQVGAALRREFPGDLVAAALAQHELRLAGRAKFTRAMRMFFTRPGLEQASVERVARHRAARFTAASRILDLCTGIGGDLVALAGAGPVRAVDLDPLHLRMAGLNADACGVAGDVELTRADVRDVDLDGADAAFVDPARREAGRRLRAGESRPELAWCLGVAERVPAVGIKAAPGIPHELVPAGWELEFVAVGRDLKEAVLWSPALATAGRRATLLPAEAAAGPDDGPDEPDGYAGEGGAERHADVSGTGGGPYGPRTLTAAPGARPSVAVRPPGGFLLDPNPAVTRAGLVEELADTVGAWKIDERIAFLSLDRAARTPFARTLRVLDSLPWHHRHIARRLRDLDIGAIDIRRRGLAGDVAELRRRFRPKGSLRAVLVMTRVMDRPWALICADC